MLFMVLVSLFQLSQHFIGVLFFVFLGIFGALNFSLFCFFLDLSSYCDVNWNGDPNDWKSTIVWFFFYDSLISLKSKKQNVTPRSSTEAEYCAMALTTCEIIWLHLLLANMVIYLKDLTPLHCDIKSVIHISCNSVFHEQIKNIETDCHFTRRHLQLGILSLPLVPSALQIVDILTKSHSV